jgi:hypothetical protein
MPDQVTKNEPIANFDQLSRLESPAKDALFDQLS